MIVGKQTLKELQAALAIAVNENPPDTALAQVILSEIMSRDTQVVRFSTDAGIINRLGQELVGRQETAVAELIKNSYDADATYVKLTFSDTYQSGGTLHIEDDGLGMNKEQLLNGFMRLSSADKLLNPLSIRYKRRRAGRKGIGRFAVQSLGSELVLTTQTVNATSALQIVINWDDFQSGLDLNTITSKIQEVPKEREEGTTLLISDLRVSWSDTEQKRVYRYASEVLQPIPVNKLKKKRVKKKDIKSADVIADPGFAVTLFSKTGVEEKIVANQEETIFSHALAVIDAYVDYKGEGIWSVESKNLGIKDNILPIGSDTENTKPFNALKGVGLKAYYFIWGTGGGYIPKLLRTSITELGRQQGGVRVFRNGFRVSPYGDRENDWLELDASSAARKILPPHSNSNFFAFIELDDPQGELFEELSSREGLIENEAFKELRDFAYRVLTAAVLRVAEFRKKKQTKSQTDWNKDSIPEETPTDAVNAAVDKVNSALNKATDDISNVNSDPNSFNDNSSDQDTASNDILANVKAAVAELAVVVKDAVQTTESKLLEELGMLRVLASLGLVIGEFTHEVRQTLGAAQGNAEDLVEAVPEGSEEFVIAKELASNVKRFKTYAGYFDRTVSDNAARQLEPHDLRIVTRQFVDAMAPAAQRKGVTIQYTPKGYELFTPPMHASEISSLLFNFYSNSLKAIKRRDTGQGKLHISVGLEEKMVFLEFADDGIGIADNIRERIFNAFFTTSTPASRDQPLEVEAQGSGLGLKIVRDIVTVYKGEVSLTVPPTGYSTCFRVTLPFTSMPENED